MLAEQNDVFYYLTLMNENYALPDLPEFDGLNWSITGVGTWPEVTAGLGPKPTFKFSL